MFDVASRLGQVLRARWTLRSCDRIGRWTRTMFGPPIIENNGSIELGDRTRLMSEFAPVELRTAKGGRLVIGERTGINYGTSFHVVESVTVGRNVDMGPHCIVTDADTGSVDQPERASTRPVVIGDGAWLASRVTVLPGSTIGAGSIIAAGSVVDGPIPPAVLAGGIPARVLRHLDATSPVFEPPVPAPENTDQVVPVAPRRDVAPITGRGLLISDFTVDHLALALERPEAERRLHAEVAPFGTVVPTLLTPPADIGDFAVVWTRPEAILPTMARLLDGAEVTADEILGDVDRLFGLVEQGLGAVPCVVVPTWTLAPWCAVPSLTGGRPGGALWALNLANGRLMERCARSANVFVVDASRWIAATGADAYKEKLWFLGKVPFDERVFEIAADDISAAVAAVSGAARKLVVVDLDNTLWGGVVGDDGWEALRLGGHDGAGEAFVEFQRALRQLGRTGVLLAIVSKNDEAVALEAIDHHGAMVLRRDDFVAWRINWDDKAANIAALTAELNLGLQSVVFIDDNPHERERVRTALPEVLVPDWPDDPTAYPQALRSLRCFDRPATSAEDLNRTALYVTERRRDELLASVGSLDEWIRDLGVVVKADRLGSGNVARSAQLLNKTNQMNLRTRRLSEPELLQWADDEGHQTWCITVSDRLGDAGLTGIVSIAVEDDRATLVDYVLSCRVMGRRVEPAMVHIAALLATDLGARRLVAELLPTAKNDPCRRFFDSSGFTRTGEYGYEWELDAIFPAPADITIDIATALAGRTPA
ncbi:MAG TPA: HAD-IIIC family phosphatase [Acidimicrobiales bacterium]|jgi:FkbH-like protein